MRTINRLNSYTYYISASRSFSFYMIRTFLLGCILILYKHTTTAQTQNKTSHFLSINAHAGSNYYPGGALEDELSNGYTGLDLRYGRQSYDQKDWTAVFNYANYGLGYWASQIGDTDIFSHPMAFYGFINFPVYRDKKFEIMAGPALGLAFNLKPYHPTFNPKNDLTGGKFAAYFNPSLSIAYKISNSLDLNLGGNFIHMSNGGISQPNTGFDQYGLHFGVRWHLNRKNTFETSDYSHLFPEKRRKNQKSSSSINIFQAFGGDQNAEDLDNDTTYLVGTTTIEYQYKFNEIHGFTAGFNLFYDESAPLSIAYPEHQTKLFPGIHAGYDFHFWKLAIRQQFGYLITEAGRDIKAGFFMRLGLSIDLTDALYFQAAVKSKHGFKADWGDFGFGLRLNRK